MKYLILLVLLVGCGESEKNNVTTSKYVDVGLGDYNINDTSTKNLANGVVNILDENSWELTSHQNHHCIDNPASRCNKIDFDTADNYKYNDVLYEFDFTLMEYNESEPPYYIIIWQDWRKRNPLDSNGRHPITTIKVKYDNGVYLTHCENSWQWGYDFGDDPDDTNHTLHQENSCHGKHYFAVGETVSIKFYINQFGASLLVNNERVSYVKYKTKSDIEDHKLQWGMYWSNEYNNQNEQDKRITARFDGFTRMVKE